MIEVKGVRETINNITQFGKDADRLLGIAMAKVVFKVTTDAKANAPVLTGFLRNNIVPNVTLGKKGGIRGRVTSQASYSVFQEFGTSRGVSPRRFMGRALSSNFNFIQKELGKALTAATLRARKNIR